MRTSCARSSASGRARAKTRSLSRLLADRARQDPRRARGPRGARDRDRPCQ
jgi:hypothetical protein